MYRLLVIDDEEDIRRGIVDSIDWGEWGYEVAAEASDGIEAIRVIEELHPDVILSDIRMPGLDGVALMQYMSANHPEIRMVVLSGYSDFEYLDMSIRNGIAAYLLKPTDLEDFERTFRELAAQMTGQRMERERREALAREAGRSGDYMRRALLQSLLRGEPGDEKELTRQLEQAGLWEEGDRCRVMAASLDYEEDMFQNTTWERRKALKGELLRRLEREAAKSGARGIFLESGDHMICGLVSGGRPPLPGERKNCGPGETAGETTEETTGETDAYAALISCVSQRAGSLADIPELYGQARRRLNRKLYERENKPGEEQGGLCTAAGLSAPSAEEIARALVEGNTDSLRDFIRAFYRRFLTEEGGESSEMDFACMKFLLLLSEGGERLNLSLRKLTEDEGNPFDSMFDVESLRGREAYSLYCLGLFKRELLGRRYQDPADKLAVSMLGFLEENYASPQISLYMVAEHLNRTPAYISKVFKEETGESFVKYVRKRRMEEAGRLLMRTNLKVYEIAEKVGYADMSNFMKTFKKYYGVTPLDYQLRRGGRDGE